MREVTGVAGDAGEDTTARERYDAAVRLERVAAGSVRVARDALRELKALCAAPGDGGEAVWDLEVQVAVAEGELAVSMEPLVTLDSVVNTGWVLDAVSAGRDVMRELGEAHMAAPGCAEQVSERPEYWVGRLEGALAGLIMAVSGEIGE